MRTRPVRALVLSAHTDDAEIGCGGYLARLLEEGTEVHALIFSAAEASVPDELPRDIVRRESADAAGILGVPASRWRVGMLPVRHFPEHRQEILETLFRYRTELQPD